MRINFFARRKPLTIIILSLGVIYGRSLAGDVSDKKTIAVPPIVQAPEESWIHGDIGVEFSNQYIDRGFIYESKGLITQPYLDLKVPLYQGDGFINSFALTMGLFETFTSRKTQAGLTNGGHQEDLRAWFESDFLPGISITFLTRFTLGEQFVILTSPNSAFNTLYRSFLTLSFDDSDILGPFALRPYFEWDRNLATDGNFAFKGDYYTFGIAPRKTFGPVTLKLLGAAGFYSGDFVAPKMNGLSFLSAGVGADYALPFIPKKIGKWWLVGNINYYYLGAGSYLVNVPQIRAADAMNLYIKADFASTFSKKILSADYTDYADFGFS
jgi:hypothetical protein